MSNTLLLKRSGVANSVPSTSSLSLGELAINTYDGLLYTKVDTGVPAVVDLTKTQLTGDATGNRVGTTGLLSVTLSNTAVTPGTYGAANAIPTFTVDSKGRITSAGTFAIDSSLISNGTSNVSIPVVNGNILLVAGGTTTGVITSTGANIAGYITATGNVTAPYFIGDLIGNITGNVDAAGSNTQVQFNDTGDILGASANFTFNKDTNVLTVTGNISGGNLDASGLTSTNTLVASGNANVGNLGTAGSVVATGNVSGGNLTTGGVVSATGNVSGGNLITSGLASIGTTLEVTGNANVGNLGTAGSITATGNITAGNIMTSGSGGNISGANVVSANTFNASANVIAGNLNSNAAVTGVTGVFSGNVSTGNVSGTTGTFTNIAGTLTTAAQPNITSVGNLTSLVVTGNVTGGNIDTAGVIVATGNITGGNLVTAGNIDASNLNATGRVYAATGDFVGNVTAGNVTVAAGTVEALTVTATGNVNGANVNTNNIVGTGLLITSTGTLELGSTTDVIDVNGARITELGTPTQATDAVTKQYVDDAVSTGITIHPPVDVESPDSAGSLAATYVQGGTTATVTDTVAGNTVVFSSAINPQVNDQLWFSSSFSNIAANTAYFVVSAPNTSAAVLSTTYSGIPVDNITSASGLTQGVRINSGQGATLTANVAGALVVDGYSCSVGNRVLVYNQNNSYENGVYEVTDAGNVSAPWVMTRASDMNTYIPDSINGMDAGDYFFVKYGNTGAGESYVMTAPIGPFVIGYDGVTFTQFSASQVYSANTQAGLSLTGTIFSAKVDNDTTAFDISGNIIVKTGANLVTPNIGDATGNSLTLSGNGLLSATTVFATGNVSGGNLVTAGVVEGGTSIITGNATVGNLGTAGAVTATGNVTGGNLITSGLASVGTTLSVTGNANVGNLGTAGAVTATGNVTAGNLVTAGLTSTNTLDATGNANVGNLGTAGAVTATGNVTAGNLVTAGLTSTNTFSATGNANVGNLGTSGTITATGNISGGNLTTAGLTSTNTLDATGLVTAGNLTVLGISNLGNVGNVVITGGSPDYLLQTDGAGNLTWIAPPSTSTILNGTSNVSIPVADGNVNTSVGGVPNVFVVTSTGANLAGTFNATGNTSVGNLDTAGLITATGNITGGNLVTAGGVSGATGTFTGNVTAGNASITSITASLSTTTGALIVAGGVGVAGNIYGGDIYKNGVIVLNANDTIDGGTY